MKGLAAYLDGDIDAFVAVGRVMSLRFPIEQVYHAQFGPDRACAKTEFAEAQANYLNRKLQHISLDAKRAEYLVSGIGDVVDKTIVFIPHRNLLIASEIANSAYSECSGLVFGWHANESLYPDTTIEFQRALVRVLNISTESQFTVHLPLMMYTAEEVGEIGIKLFGNGLAKLTWSCSVSDDVHCGECAGCLYRQRVFGSGDPTEYLTQGVSDANRG
jgi:7-cyano-7-deazaguanine synthase in queuosine biosynthesis